MNFRVLETARLDAASTARRLESEQPGFARTFMELYRAARAAIRDAPRRHSPTEDGPDGIETREAFIGRFNQRVIFAVTDAEVVILAVVHAHRRPGSWVGRVEEV